MAGLSREEVLKYAREKFRIEPDYPWMRDPDSAVLRHRDNEKWFALLMTVSKQKLGLREPDQADILTVKSDPILIGSLIDGQHFFSAYHMNREHWITVLLDGTTPAEAVFHLLDLSYERTKSRKELGACSG